MIKRLKLPLATCALLKREARRRRCSVSALVASVLRRDLAGNAPVRLPNGGESRR